jgi:selenocysteine lyase/cysteine desulfurase
MTSTPNASAPLTSQRHLFSLPGGLHYLNCAYMGPLPNASQDRGVEGIRRKANPTTLKSSDFFRESEEAKALFARVLQGSGRASVDASRVAILPAASYGIAIAAKNLPVAKGQNIVISAEQFPSNVYAWRRLARERGAELRTVASPRAAPPRADAWSSALQEAIDASTAVVALPHVHWTDGTRFDLVAIAARAREVGAAVVIDASQSVGALDLDVAAVQPDAVVCVAYKWLLGPYSLAYGWFGQRFDDGVPLEENWIARKDSEDFQGLVSYRDEYEPGAVRYDVGQRANFILLPMSMAAMQLLLDWGSTRIQHYCANLFEGVIAEAREMGFTAEPPAGRAAHLFGLRVPAGTDLRALDASLKGKNVHASLRGSALRLSPNAYNDESDASAMIAALKSSVGVAAGR